MDLKPGDIIFVRGTHWVDRLIERITKSKYSHVAVYVGEGLVIEAQSFRKVGYQSLSFYEGLYDAYRIPLAQCELANGMDWLKEQAWIERDYDYWDLFVLFLRSTFNFKIPWHETRRIICSRLARDFLFECNKKIPDENMTPEDLYGWVKANGYVVSA